MDGKHAVRRAHALRVPAHATTVWPGEFLEIKVPDKFSDCEVLSVEPLNCCVKEAELRQYPNLVSSVAGVICLPNLTGEPNTFKRNEPVATLCTMAVEGAPSLTMACETNDSLKTNTNRTNVKHSSGVTVDPDNILGADLTAKFTDILNEYDVVFNPVFNGCDGAVGPFKTKVNLGPLLLPLVELQNQFDSLENTGVLKWPEGSGVSVEYVSPSFLVKKPNGGFRWVTAIADVGHYSKSQPPLMPDIDSTLRQIAQWRYIIATDLTKAFHQIPLSWESMKYCGTVAPFKGVRVYVRSAMGMPGSETALEELTCRVLGTWSKRMWWPKLLMICTLEVIPLRNYLIHGKRY